MRLASERATMAVEGMDGATAARADIAQVKNVIAEQLSASDKLEQAVEQFVGDLAHDLKNPLGAVRVNVQALKRSLERGKALQPEQIVERLERVEHSIDQSLQIIAKARTKLDGTTITSSGIRREHLDLVPLVQEQVAYSTAAVGDRRIKFEQLCTQLLGRWDGECVSRVLRELLDNALKFSPPTEHVRVTLRHDGDQNAAELAIADRGIGIPAKDLPHVCERFYRGDNVLGRFKGAGLGLFEANRIAAAHNGALVIDSQEGQGSTFTLRLPCA